MKDKAIFTTRGLAMAGVAAALVFAANWIQIPIPTSIDNTRLHLGNIMCLLSGFLLGPVLGGLAAGFGCMFFDLTNPLYVNEAWITFLSKFAMAWLCGILAGRGKDAAQQKKARRWGRNTIAAGAGALLYVCLYLLKNYILYAVFMQMQWTPVLIMLSQKAVVSLINAVFAVVVSVPLANAVKAALVRNHLFQRPMNQ